MKVGKGSCNGTFGELLQGELNRRPFLVTLPIDSLKSNAVFLPNFSSHLVYGPPGKAKATKACERLLRLYGVHSGGTLQISSNIPSGKGLASSSADIVAAIRAVAESFQLMITEEIISRIASDIEPTDGVMYDGVVAYDYIHGDLLRKLGNMPDFGLVGIDIGGAIDTVQFNSQSKRYTEKEQLEFLRAYELMKRGFVEGDLSLIFEASTKSAKINQTILPKPFFHDMEELAKSYEGGIVVAHSGTVMGILLNGNHPQFNSQFRDLTEKISLLTKDRAAPLIQYTNQNVNFVL